MDSLSSDVTLSEQMNTEENSTPAKSCCKTKVTVETKQASPNIFLAYILQYQPVLIIASTALVGAWLFSYSKTGGFNFHLFIHSAMGLFLLPLALLKLFNISGFVSSFARYDILTKLWRPYGYIYPVIELALALLFLAGLWLSTVYVMTLVVMGLGSIGIISQLSQGKKLDCACVGAIVKVPLGLISIIENVGMALMAAIMLSVH